MGIAWGYGDHNLRSSRPTHAAARHPGHPNQRFLMRVNEDGSILLQQPAHVDTAAQQEYDSNPELQALSRQGRGVLQRGAHVTTTE